MGKKFFRSACLQAEDSGIQKVKVIVDFSKEFE
jgi:hypothetical protein